MVKRPGRTLLFYVWFFLVFAALLLVLLYFMGRSAYLEYRYQPGDTFRYRTSLLLTGSVLQRKRVLPLNSSVTCELVQRVSSVAEDGAMNIEVATEKASGTLSGNPLVFSRMPPKYTYRMSPTGKYLEITAAINPNGVSNLEFILPKRKLKPGDSWQGERKLLLPGQTVPVFIPCKYRFYQWQKVKGYMSAVIRASIARTEIPLSQGGAATVLVWGDGTCYFAYPEGAIVLNDFNLYLSFIRGGRADLIMKIRNTTEIL